MSGLQRAGFLKKIPPRRTADLRGGRLAVAYSGTSDRQLTSSLAGNVPVRLVLAVPAINPVLERVLDLSSQVVTIDLAVKQTRQRGRFQPTCGSRPRTVFFSSHLFSHPLSTFDDLSQLRLSLTRNCSEHVFDPVLDACSQVLVARSVGLLCSLPASSLRGQCGRELGSIASFWIASFLMRLSVPFYSPSTSR